MLKSRMAIGYDQFGIHVKEILFSHLKKTEPEDIELRYFLSLFSDDYKSKLENSIKEQYSIDLRTP